MSATESDPTSGSASELDVDVAVIGLGSAGEQIAKLCAQSGMSVVGFEPELVGGECPFLACIPSKSLLHDAKTGERSWKEAVERRDRIVDHRDDEQHAEGLRETGVHLVRETAVLTGEHTLESESYNVKARYVVVATGAAPSLPPIPGTDGTHVWTSADALVSDKLPGRLLILGSGPIGSELSQVYSSFGSKVILVERSDHLTDDAAPEISERLRDALEKSGVDVRTGMDAKALVHHADDVVVEMEDGTSFSVDKVLIATGVTPRLGSIGLDSIGLGEDVEIDDYGQMGGLDWLWAAGDVTPTSMWTHGASIQARQLADRFQGRAWPEAPTLMPRCTFTFPPIGVVGQTTSQAQDRGLKVITGSAEFSDTARHATDELDDGYVEIVVDATMGSFVGASMIGPRADDLVQIVTALITGGVTISEAHRMVFPFPTLSQVLEVAIDDAAKKYAEHRSS